MTPKQTEIITFKASKAFKTYIEAKAKDKGLPLAAWIKAVVRKQTGFREPEVNV